jgi:hypothetical protein
MCSTIAVWRLLGTHPLSTTTHAVDKIEWKEPLAIIKYPDPRLRAANARVGLFTEDLKRLSQAMLKVMYE